MVRGQTSNPESALLDGNHPVHIGSYDNPGALLVSMALTGPGDYFSWVMLMRRALMTKNKLGFVDGSASSWDPPTAGDSMFPAWER
ncbi:hypothetical protein LINPERHAP1_LOCUS3818 [Linum perenne]